jgi:hypothetical protein
VTPGSQADPPVPQEQAPAPAVQEVDPPAVVTTPGQAAPSAPRAPEAETAPKPAAGQSSAVPAGTEARGASPQARLALVRAGKGYLCFGSFSVCPDPALSLPFSKRRQGSTGLAPRKALKTVPASAASAAARHASWLASAQDALERAV